jgi:enoyl-CoA hydratase
VLTLDRPRKLNAVDPVMIGELNAALDRAESDPAVRVILLRGEGRAFSAGFDLGITADDPAAWRAELRRELDLIMRFWYCPKPTIAAVHGYCLGSAMELAVACDVTFSARDCRFGAPEVRYGSGIICLILPWIVGPKIAKELLLSGDDRVDASRALAIGLVNRVFDTERLLEDALDFARGVAANDAHAVRLTKRAINRGLDRAGMRAALDEALEHDVEIESHETPGKRRFNEILARDGLKAAIAWREEHPEDTP